MKAGQFAIPASDYLADTGNDVPTLNSTVARVLLADSPRHAFWTHPRLSPAYASEQSTRFDLGKAAHALILEGDESCFVVIDAKDYKTKAAQEDQKYAWETGRIPILTHQLTNVRAMAAAIKLKLPEFERPIPFTGGKAEVTLVWQEGDVWCRARLDWLHDSRLFIDDLKTTEASANPEVWGRTMYNSGLDIQAAFYSRGVKALFNVEPTFRFFVAESYEPYEPSMVSLAPDAMALAHAKVSRAIEIWRECVKSGDWPGYSRRTAYVEAPGWERERWESAQMVAAGLKELNEWEKGDRL